jgi:ribonuclease BN (tRNA processing enzyme)
MILTFLGTKGYIEEKNRRHRKHSCLLVTCCKKRLLIDWGEDWQGQLNQVGPHWILITHAHPDHAFGLKEGTQKRVYAARYTFKFLKNFPLPHLKDIKKNKPLKLGPFKISTYPCIHSIKTPAVGFRIEAGKNTLVYNPDVVFIRNKKRIFKGVDIYIGDGATISRPLVRRKKGKLFGHASIKTQINWCKKFKIREVIFTHFGKEAVGMGERNLRKKLRELSGSKLKVTAAFDGMRRILR